MDGKKKPLDESRGFAKHHFLTENRVFRQTRLLLVLLHRCSRSCILCDWAFVVAFRFHLWNAWCWCLTHWSSNRRWSSSNRSSSSSRS